MNRPGYLTHKNIDVISYKKPRPEKTVEERAR